MCHVVRCDETGEMALMLMGGKAETSMGSDSSGSALQVLGRAVLQRARLGSRARARRGGNHSSD